MVRKTKGKGGHQKRRFNRLNPSVIDSEALRILNRLDEETKLTQERQDARRARRQQVTLPQLDFLKDKDKDK